MSSPIKEKSHLSQSIQINRNRGSKLIGIVNKFGILFARILEIFGIKPRISFSISPYVIKEFIAPGPVTRDESAQLRSNLNANFRHVYAEWRELKGKGIKIAVLDTGIDLDHPSLKNSIKASR